jgi:hypothetical protein
VAVENYIYLLQKDGRLQCVEWDTGKEVYLQRVHSSQHRTSPIYADGHLYMASSDGTVSVVKVDRSSNWSLPITLVHRSPHPLLSVTVRFTFAPLKPSLPFGNSCWGTQVAARIANNRTRTVKQNMEINLKNKVAIVTGAASGVGLATTLCLLESGITGVVAVDLQRTCLLSLPPLLTDRMLDWYMCKVTSRRMITVSRFVSAALKHLGKLIF